MMFNEIKKEFKKEYKEMLNEKADSFIVKIKKRI